LEKSTSRSTNQKKAYEFADAKKTIALPVPEKHGLFGQRKKEGTVGKRRVSLHREGRFAQKEAPPAQGGMVGGGAEKKGKESSCPVGKEIKKKIVPGVLLVSQGGGGLPPEKGGWVGRKKGEPSSSEPSFGRGFSKAKRKV